VKRAFSARPLPAGTVLNRSTEAAADGAIGRKHDILGRTAGPALDAARGTTMMERQKRMELPVILIPAYKPDEKLIELIERLQAAGYSRIVVADDGGGAAFAAIFAQVAARGCTVLTHSINMGKGRALKTGLNYCLAQNIAAAGVITADADGQHTCEDIGKLAAAMSEHPDALVLGVRYFTGKVPLRNKTGNTITRLVFSVIHGQDVRDTQTGLRGIPFSQMPLILSLSGERYEYEMNMLLAVRPNDIELIQVPIETIYIDGNSHSHYNVLLDSFRIYRLLFKFLGSSFIATIVDYLIFTLMNLSVPNQVFSSVVVARVVSSMVNFSINRNIVFKRKNMPRYAIVRYYALATAVMFASYGLIKFFAEPLGLNIYVAKIFADSLLTTFSYVIQRDFVYHDRKRSRSAKKQKAGD
jgi:glycosyltransferase involved in cell wall biosynthesis